MINNHEITEYWCKKIIDFLQRTDSEINKKAMEPQKQCTRLKIIVLFCIDFSEQACSLEFQWMHSYLYCNLNLLFLRLANLLWVFSEFLVVNHLSKMTWIYLSKNFAPFSFKIKLKANKGYNFFILLPSFNSFSWVLVKIIINDCVLSVHLICFLL